jgi:hypothetical protein
VARARRKADRLRQILNWLKQEYPCAKPVRLIMQPRITGEQKKHFGWVDYYDDDSLVISLVKTYPLDVLIESLIHEYAHCRQYPKGSGHNSRIWKDNYGRMYEHFYDREGCEESCDVGY